MNDAKKEQPKTYSLEEILACTKSDHEDIFSSSGANDWIENPTRFKLREAKYFYKQVETICNDYLEDSSKKNHDELLFSLSAFFSAIRSITGNYMQKQYSDKPGFYEWYCPHHLGDDPELRFLNQARTDFIHICAPIIETQKTVFYNLDVRIADNEGRVPESPPTYVYHHHGIKATKVTFRPAQTKWAKLLKKEELEVLPFCLSQLSKLDKLVGECEKQFNKPSHNRCDEILSGAPSEESS